MVHIIRDQYVSPFFFLTFYDLVMINLEATPINHVDRLFNLVSNALWITELMNYFNIERCAFIGPSYGAGIILRLAVFMPNKIDCSILVSPAGIQLGSKLEMITDIFLPLLLFHTIPSSSEKYLNKITNIMSANSMKEIDKLIIVDIFKFIKLEQEMPKIELKLYGIV